MKPTFTIKALGEGEDYPFDLLRLADPDQAVLESYLIDSKLFVLEEAAKILGVLVLKELKDDELEIMNIAIEEKQQGKGWGKVLLNFGIEEAKKRKAKSLWIATGNSSIGQLALYQKMGFEMAEIRRDHFLLNYAEPIWENGIQCKHMIRLKREF
ncbi:MAG: GNAT family N-acetyltransferase [Bacteroidia bacterium]|nr:GNAT family N-acetyltransferase [Bacteroidia bacterium]